MAYNFTQLVHDQHSRKQMGKTLEQCLRALYPNPVLAGTGIERNST